MNSDLPIEGDAEKVKMIVKELVEASNQSGVNEDEQLEYY